MHGHGTTAAGPETASTALFRHFAVAALGTTAWEDVEFVDEMNHTVGVDGIVPRVATHRGCERARHVALLMQDVVDLETNRGGLAF